MIGAGWRWLGVAILLSGLWACTEQATLSGSLSEVYRIDYSSVRVRLYEDDLAVEYVGVRGSVPVRVSVRLPPEAEVAGQTFDLATTGAITGRLIDGTELPELLSGSLTLEGFEARSGVEIRGEFAARFTAGEDVLTLGGTFEAPLEVVDRFTRRSRAVVDGGELESQQDTSALDGGF